MYHYVDASLNPTDPYAAGNTVSPEQFAAQMDYLAANGYHPVTLEQVYIAMAGLGSLPAKPVVLTFDDGWKDQYTVVFPILRSHDFVATFFVITGHVGLGHERSMSWDELREMEDQGMAIESHTVHHLDLRTLTPVRLQSELTESRDNIWAMLGELPMAFAYPSGAYNQRVIAAVRAAGYRIAVTTHFGKILDPSHTFEWPRVRVTPYESLAVFARELA
jgi:peptidoglycan/xylan/chitin deacetylase (PgdA/CDA1 family)